jgi:hypothetical protein
MSIIASIQDAQNGEVSDPALVTEPVGPAASITKSKFDREPPAGWARAVICCSILGLVAMMYAHALGFLQ